MATFVLLHGAASDGWYWHLVEPALQAAGHRTIAPRPAVRRRRSRVRRVRRRRRGGDRAAGDRRRRARARRPVDGRVHRPDRGDAGPGRDDRARRRDDAGARRVGRRLVDEHRLRGGPSGRDGRPRPARRAVRRGGGVPPRRPRRRRAPSPGPTSRASPDAVRGAVAARGLARRADPVPAVPRRPAVPARLPAPGGGERLGIVPDEMAGGHLPALAHPAELADRLLRYVADLHAAG